MKEENKYTDLSFYIIENAFKYFQKSKGKISILKLTCNNLIIINIKITQIFLDAQKFFIFNYY